MKETMEAGQPGNEQIASILDRIASLLEAQRANPFRVGSYRDAANSVRNYEQPIAGLVNSGDRAALEALPDIGEGIAGLIEEFVRTGRSSLLDRLQSEVSPEQVFNQVPGIGPELAGNISRDLNINTLAELEQAAHDGRLDQVEGFGPERVEAVKVTLAGMLSGAALTRRSQGGKPAEMERPSVAILLDVDREYREKAEAGALKKIAPKRLNPTKEAWLPVLNARRGDWKFTALFSNTAQAHKLGKTSDWVVIYYQRPGMPREGQATVVTATSGALKGRRVVRGREVEAARYYDQGTKI